MIWSLAFRYFKKKTIWIASATPRNRDIKLEVQQALPDIVQADDVMRGRWADLERWWADCRQVWSSRCQGSRSEQSEWQDRNHNWSAEAFFSAMLTLRRSTTWRQKGSEKKKNCFFLPFKITMTVPSFVVDQVNNIAPVSDYLYQTPAAWCSVQGCVWGVYL